MMDIKDLLSGAFALSHGECPRWALMPPEFSSLGCPVFRGEVKPTGCGPTITSAQIWHWAESPQNSGSPWPHSVATSEHR